MEIYWASGSPYAWRVLLTLEWKGIAYESRLLSFQKGDHKTDAYRAISPRAKIPGLRDGAFTLSESLAMMVYLERKYPERPLFGRTPEEAGLIQRAISDYESWVDRACEGFILPLYFGGAEEKAEEVRAHGATLRTELAGLDALLGAQPFLVGSQPSAADFVWFPHVKSIERAAGKDAAKPFELALLPYASTYPALAAWIGRIEALPGYERTYPPHWR
jgi:glutathione S-transferase